MKKILLLACLAFLVAVTQAQILIVKDADSSEPVENVTLMSGQPKAFVLTNVRGQADVSAFNGAQSIEIRRLGYKTEIRSFTELAQANFVLTLQSTAIQSDEVYVSATRWSQPSSHTLSRISTISSREVTLLNPQTAADMLAATGEVFIQKSQQGGGSPMIRGFATNRLLYAVDGVRMNSAIFRAGNIQNVISLDPLAIEQTEVLFGPGSVIYGSDAIGGVMSFQTLRPQLSLTDSLLLTGKALSRYSSANGETTHHFDISIGSAKWASVSSLTYSQFGDLRMGTSGPEEYLRKFYVQRIDNTDRIVTNPQPLIQTPTGYAQTNLMQKVKFKPSRNWELEYALHYSETSEYSRYDRLIEILPNGLPRSAVWNYGPQIWAMNHLSVANRRQSGLYDQMYLRLAHQYFEESRIDRNFSGGQRFRLRTQLEQVQAYSANLDFEKNVASHRFYYGVEYIRNNVNSQGSAIDIRDNSNIAVADRYPASQWSSYAAYLNYQYLISEKWMLQAGARYNIFGIYSDFSRHLQFFPFEFSSASLQNSATTGSIGFVYRPDNSTKISIHGSTGFRAPNVDDIGKIFDFAGGEVVVPNPRLRAEYAYNTDLNISKQLADFIRLDLTGFYTRMDNAMVRRPFRLSGQDSILYDGEMSRVYAIQNAARASVYGFNIGVEVKLPFGFSIGSRYNYQLGEEEMDNGELSRSRHAAPAFGLTRLSFQYNKLTMQWYAQYSREVSYANLNQEERQKPTIYAKDPEGNPFSPTWYTLNFKVMYHFNQYFTLSSGLENITDQRYRPYSSGLVAPGRNFILSLRAHF